MPFSTGQVPSVLKITKVVPINKKQSKVDYTSYRPISLVLGLRQFLATGRLLKMIKNAFYFTSKALFVLKIFRFLC